MEIKRYSIPKLPRNKYGIRNSSYILGGSYGGSHHKTLSGNYLPAQLISSGKYEVDLDLVDFTGDISSNRVLVNGIIIDKLKDGILQINGDLAVTGEITSFSLGNKDISTIMDGIVCDETTITKLGGKLTVIGGGSAGGAFDINKMWEELRKADNSKIIDISHIPNLYDHINNTTIHITSDERTTWDGYGNVIKQHIDNSDIHITSDERSKWNGYNNTISSHIGNSDIHITSDERSKWNGYNNTISSHIGNSDIHITSDERTTWNEATNHTYNHSHDKIINNGYDIHMSKDGYIYKTGNVYIGSEADPFGKIYATDFVEGGTALSSKYAPLNHSHNSIKDIGNDTLTTFAYSKDAIALPTYLAGWNGYELRAVNSDVFWTSNNLTPSNYLPLAGGSMIGPIYNTLYQSELQEALGVLQYGGNWPCSGYGWAIGCGADSTIPQILLGRCLNSTLQNWLSFTDPTNYINLVMPSDSRIDASGGDLYIGDADNSGWVKTSDICSSNGSEIWNISTEGAALFNSVTVGDIYSDYYHLHNNVSNPYLRFTLGNNIFYCQAYDGKVMLGPTAAKSLQVDPSGNVTTNGDTVVNGYMSATGLVTSLANGEMLTIGSQQANYVDYATTALLGHYFYKNLTTQGSIISEKSISSNSVKIEANTKGLYDSSKVGEINRFDGVLCLQYSNAFNTSLCHGGGKVAIGNIEPEYKLDIWDGGIRIGGYTNEYNGFDNVTSPQILFSSWDSQLNKYVQQAKIIYTDVDRYRKGMGLKVVGLTGTPNGELDEPLWFEVDGNVIATGEITAFSDARLKSDIKPLEDRGRLKPVTYKKDGKDSIGFLAQDVLKLYPELVTDGEYLSLNYPQLTAVLASQLNKAMDKIDQLENKLNQLENKINSNGSL